MNPPETAKEKNKAVEPLLLDGRALRDARIIRLREAVAKSGTRPTLAILQVGDLEESRAYIDQKKKFAEKIGAIMLHKKFPEDIGEHALVDSVNELNRDASVNGVIVQLPIPEKLSKQKIIDAIAISKDVDGLTSTNKKLFMAGDKRATVPATARGVLSLLKGYGIAVSGKKVTVIGRSQLVGAPIAVLLASEGADVTVCHRETEGVPEKSRSADILVVAIGVPRFITKEYVSPGQTVVDVGINLVTGEKLEDEIPKRQLVGDVDFESVKSVVSGISPVPGGVGPMTVLSLFENLLDAAKIVYNAVV